MKSGDVNAYSDQARGLRWLRLLMAFLIDFHGLESRNDRADLLDVEAIRRGAAGSIHLGL
jgi:hypothetical protein